MGDSTGNRTDFEKDFGIDLSTGSAGIEKAIEMGIQIEQAGQKFYLEKASQANIPQVRHHLNRLAQDEVQHTEMLQELKKSLMDKGEWIGARPLPDTKARLKELAAFKPGKPDKAGKAKNAGKGTPNVENTSSAIQVLYEALKLEERVSSFYKGLADEVKNEKGRAFFEALAKWEYGHYELIKQLIEIVHGMAGTWG